MAELTFNSPIRRDKWPRWMIKLHEYLTRIYDRPIPEVDYDDYDRLKRIIRIFHHHRAADYFGIHSETCRKNVRYTWLALLDGTTHGEERMG